MLNLTLHNEQPNEQMTDTTPELNIDDLVWLREQGLALRNVKKSIGLAEVSQGGTGDAYSLAYYFNPDEAIISETDPEELALRRKLVGPMFEMLALEDKDLFPSKSGHMNAEFVSLVLVKNLQELFTQSEKVQKIIPEKIKQALTDKMKNKLLQILENCLKQPKGKELNFFEIIERPEAQFPKELSNKNVYPTGKCGTAPFSAKQIKATFEEEPSEIQADSHKMYAKLFCEVKKLKTSQK